MIDARTKTTPAVLIIPGQKRSQAYVFDLCLTYGIRSEKVRYTSTIYNVLRRGSGLSVLTSYIIKVMFEGLLESILNKVLGQYI